MAWRDLALLNVIGVLAMFAAVSGASVEWKTSAFRLVLDDQGRLERLIAAPSGQDLAAEPRRVFAVRREGTEYRCTAVKPAGERLIVTFGDRGGTATFRVRAAGGSLLFDLLEIQPRQGIERLTLFSLSVKELGTIGGTINACYNDEVAVAVMATKRFVECRPWAPGRYGGNKEGVTSTFEVTPGAAKEGNLGGEFRAASGRDKGDGWAVRGKEFAPPLDLRGIKGLSLWLHGDGKGEMFKVQLYDGQGGYRDDYVKVDFTGWKYIELTEPAQDQVDYGHVTRLNLYYNGIPAKSTVTCLVDDIRARRTLLGKPEAAPGDIVLEDFEDPDGAIRDRHGVCLEAFAHERFGIEGAGFGLIVAPRSQFTEAIEQFEIAAGLPHPHLSGQWSKTSPDTKRSYLFIQGFGEQNADQVIAAARRGHFALVLIGEFNWARTGGHYEINKEKFPRGLDSLRDTVAKFHAAGLKVGLHFLGAGVFGNDAYLTPVPDPRLFRDHEAILAADIDAKMTTVPTTAAPEDFPKEDGGYEGEGAVLQIDEELILYGDRALQEPFGFINCLRGAFGTRAAAHRKGAKIQHLKKSYGYFLHDMDTDLTDEIAARVGKVANYCHVDMLYFDGSERLQGPHWYYNARLQKAFYDALDNKDVLLQGSSYSHYSWHFISRHASADGQRDWKAYLDKRLAWLPNYAKNLMPLDLGWYGIWSSETTLDQVEYVLQKSLGLGCSVSIQTNPTMLADHPQMPEILDRVAAYERLRLEGKVPAGLRAEMREPGKEFVLTGTAERPAFRRVKYGSRRAIAALDGKSNVWELELPPEVKRPELQLEIEPGRMLIPGPSYRSPEALVLETFDNLAAYVGKDPKGFEEFVIGPGKAGTCREGVTLSFESVADDPKEGARCGKYSATSTLGFDGGWSSIGKRFDPPLDLSWHKGIGFWLKGDSSGALFKLQLRDDKQATDYYIKVDYDGWRYHQLLRPEEDPIDYTQVRFLIFYYNGMPAKSTCTVFVDDVKALAAVDECPLVNPACEINGSRLAFPVSLQPGERIVYRGPSDCRVLGGQQALPQTLTPQGAAPALHPGKNVLQFICEDGELPREALVRESVLY